MADLAVVVPTRDRPAELALVLDALGRQRLGDGTTAEVVVVDNGSAPAARRAIDAAVAACPLPARVVEHPEPNIAAARNAGAAATGAPVLVFTNDDVVPGGDGWLAGHAQEHRERPAPLAVLGPVVWAPGLEQTRVMRWMSAHGHSHNYDVARRTGEVTPGELYANNLSVTRAAFDAVGGFDPRLGGYGWEEYDLGLRLHDHGLHSVFREDLVGHHHHAYTLEQSLRRWEAIGRATVVFNRLHAGRAGLLSPHPSPWKVRLGRATAPVATRIPADRLPPKAAEPLLWYAHHAALAKGFAEQQEQAAA